MAKIPYKARVGSVILGLLNGLKHTPQTISSLLNIAPRELEMVISGEKKLTPEIEKALISVTGINQRDFYPAKTWDLFPVIDDTNDGIVIFRAQDTFQSRRILTRGPKNISYYIYADTAMSNLSTFRPEWIQPLYIHNGQNPDDLPDWAFNKGHFEHQVTYFVGPVNFHWIDAEGKKHVCQMDTGDTNYIVPFVPHSFTTRVAGEGFILAVTYGGAISNPEFRNDLSFLDIEEYISNVKERLSALSSKFLDLNGEVRLAGRFEGELSEEKIGFQSITLINPNCQPGTKVTELKLEMHGSRFSPGFSDCWGYNIGNYNVFLAWGRGNEILLKPGDSLLIKPKTPHLFSGLGMAEGKLLLVDISPQEGDPYAELAMIDKFTGEAGLRRAHTETTRWY